MAFAWTRCQRIIAVLATLTICMGGPGVGQEPAAGSLVVAAAQDTSGGFRVVQLAELGLRALVWPEGMITIPDSLPWYDDGESGLAIALDVADLAGIGAGGRFRPRPGRFELDTPLVLIDGSVYASFTSGSLEIEDGRLTYRRPPAKRGARGDYYVLAGLVLATAVLLRAVRRRARRA